MPHIFAHRQALRAILRSTPALAVAACGAAGGPAAERGNKAASETAAPLVAPRTSPTPSPMASTGWAPDRALRTATAKDAEGGEISCTFYEDFMIRVPGTDTPEPDKALLIRAGGTAPACSAVAPAGLSLDTGGYAFQGRTGVYLFFEVASSNGSVDFLVIDSRTGATIIDDITEEGLSDPGTIRAITATPQSLTLAFRRARNTDCSILASPASCWKQITANPEFGIPPEIARLAPPTEACVKSYSAASIPRDDPSIISYPVEVRWTQGGGANRVQASGPLGCWPMP